MHRREKPGLGQGLGQGMFEYRTRSEACAHDGIIGSGKMGQRFTGKISLDREVNNCVTSFKNQHSTIPLFHGRGKKPGLENLVYFH
jgi:hypothetical protein